MTVVNPDNGARSDVYKNILSSIADSGECPFCPGGYTWKNQEMIHQEGDWVISHVDPRYSYKNARHHFLLMPRTHKEGLGDMLPKDWQELGRLADWARREFDLPAAVITMRTGETRYTGATVTHLHAHLFIPAENEKGEVQTMRVHFGPFRAE